jgi:hypothetical protein
MHTQRCQNHGLFFALFYAMNSDSELRGLTNAIRAHVTNGNFGTFRPPTRYLGASGGGKVRAGESVMKWSDAYDPTR